MEEKAKVLFRLFENKYTGDLSQESLGMMLETVNALMDRLAFCPFLPYDQVAAAITEAFDLAEVHVSESITLSDLTAWLKAGHLPNQLYDSYR